MRRSTLTLFNQLTCLKSTLSESNPHFSRAKRLHQEAIRLSQNGDHGQALVSICSANYNINFAGNSPEVVKYKDKLQETEEDIQNTNRVLDIPSPFI